MVRSEINYQRKTKRRVFYFLYFLYCHFDLVFFLEKWVNGYVKTHWSIRLIISGKLREEYSIVWIISTTILVVFSFWRKGLDVVSHIMGIYSPPNLVFTVAIFMIFIYCCPR